LKFLARRWHKTAYLDYASTTPVEPRVLEAMMPYFAEKAGNPTSFYGYAQEAKQAVEKGREQVAALIGARPREIIFTSGGTESCNTALKGVAMASKKGKHIITSRIEHFAVLEPLKWLEKQGFEVTRLPVDKYGCVSPEDLESALRDDTCLVSIMHANNEVGTIQPIKELAAVARQHKVPFHTDACISAGHVPIDVNDLGVDLLSMSAHKMYGPKGIGALYIRSGIKVVPLIHGGGQERKLRSGTENVPGIVGFGKAAEIAGAEMESEAGRLVELRDRLIKGILEIENSWLNGHPEKRLPGNVNVGFRFIEGEGIILELDFVGINGSTGSACSSPTLEPSHVLTALGLKHQDAHGSLRLTLGRGTTKEDVDAVLENLPGIIKRLRDISPFKKDFRDYEKETQWKGHHH
jgi:cysteine desulfurase